MRTRAVLQDALLFLLLGLAASFVVTVVLSSVGNCAEPPDDSTHNGAAGENVRKPFVAPTSRATETAFEWLAAHQEPDGRWDGEKLGSPGMDEALTGLATVAFLNWGQTEKSGKYKDVVRRAVAYLVSRQSDKGEIGDGRQGDPRSGYNHAVGGYALSEAYNLAQVRETREAAQRAVEWSVDHYQTESGGWSRSPAGEPDITITAWFLCQLKTASVSGIEVPQSAFDRTREYVDGLVPGAGAQSEMEPVEIAAAILVKMTTGAERTDPAVDRLARGLVDAPPTWQKDTPTVDLEHWYFGRRVFYWTLGRFWREWHKALDNTLVAHQLPDGSWGPPAAAEHQGTGWSTALGVLVMRSHTYLPIYK